MPQKWEKGEKNKKRWLKPAVSRTGQVAQAQPAGSTSGFLIRRRSTQRAVWADRSEKKKIKLKHIQHPITTDWMSLGRSWCSAHIQWWTGNAWTDPSEHRNGIWIVHASRLQSLFFSSIPSVGEMPCTLLLSGIGNRRDGLYQSPRNNNCKNRAGQGGLLCRTWINHANPIMGGRKMYSMSI